MDYTRANPLMKPMYPRRAARLRPFGGGVGGPGSAQPVPQGAGPSGRLISTSSAPGGIGLPGPRIGVGTARKLTAPKMKKPRSVYVP